MPHEEHHESSTQRDDSQAIDVDGLRMWRDRFRELAPKYSKRATNTVLGAAMVCEQAVSAIETRDAELERLKARDIPSSRLVAAHITAMGMHAENLQREAEGKSMAYTEDAFVGILAEVLEGGARDAELADLRTRLEEAERELAEEREASLNIMATAESRIDAAEAGEEWDEDAVAGEVRDV